jgi:hypothetical protein
MADVAGSETKLDGERLRTVTGSFTHGKVQNGHLTGLIQTLFFQHIQQVEVEPYTRLTIGDGTKSAINIFHAPPVSIQGASIHFYHAQPDFLNTQIARASAC